MEVDVDEHILEQNEDKTVAQDLSCVENDVKELSGEEQHTLSEVIFFL